MKKNILILIIVLIITISPSLANIIVTNGLTHQYKVDKGFTYKGTIALQNIGSEVKNVKLYGRLSCFSDQLKMLN